MEEYIVKYWTGPCDVQVFVQRARNRGLEVTCEGTEHIYVRINATDGTVANWRVYQILRGILE